MTDDLTAARERHVEELGQTFRAPKGMCAYCEQPWPCDAAIAFAALDEARASADAHWRGEGIPGCPYCDRQDAIDAKRAAEERERDFANTAAMLAAERDAARSLADELAEAGHHDKRCDVSTVAWSSEGIRCTCGWRAALAKWEACRG